MNTEDEIISAEERRLARALSRYTLGEMYPELTVEREKSGDRPRFGGGTKIKRPEATPAAGVTQAQSSENLPKWKLLQLEKERQQQEQAEAERKKKEEAAAAIAQRQLQLGADADAANEEEQPGHVSSAERGDEVCVPLTFPTL